MRINHNLMAMNTDRQLGIGQTNGAKSMEKLASGLRINRAGDDAAGLAISEKMRAQVRGLDQGSRNAQDSISMIQTAEGALSETQSILQRMRELAVQSSNDTATVQDREQMQKEIEQMKSEVDRIANDTEFNTKKLLNGSLATGTTKQGAKASSVAMDKAAVAAMAGSVDGKNAVHVATVAADPGVKGSVEAGRAYTAGSKIVSGMNDQVNITLTDKDGTINSSSITLTGSTTGKAYTLDEMVTELNTQVAKDSALNGKVTFAKNDAGTKIVLQAVNTGDSVAIAEGTTGQGALASLGFADTTSNEVNGATDSLDLTANTDMTTDPTMSKFRMTIGGVTRDIDLTSDNGWDGNTSGLPVTDDTTTGAELKAALEKHLNYAFFGDANANKFDVTSAGAALGNGNDQELRITLNDSSILTSGITVSDSGDQTGAATLFGGSASAAQAVDVNNSVTYGKAATSAQTIGTVIVAGANDQLNITADTGSAETLTLTAKTYTSRADLVSEINNQIQANENLKGKVTASLDTDNTIKFTSASTGSTSEVTVEAPATAARSALSALGYKGNVQTKIVGKVFDGNFDATSAQFKLTVGAVTKDIDFSAGNGINSNTGITAARDAIQKSINDAFGENVVKVSIEDGKLAFENLAATDTFAIKDDAISGAGMTGATKLLGYASSNGEIAGTATIADVTTDLDDAFEMTVGNVTKTIKLGTTADADILTNLQTALDNAWGEGKFSVANDGSNHIALTSSLNNTDVKLSATTGNTGLTAIVGGAAKFTRMANDALNLSNTSVDGVNAEAAGDVQLTTKLVNLTDEDGLKLGLSAGNVIKLTGTQGGKEFSASLNVTDSTTVTELIDKMKSMDAFAGANIALNEQTGKIEVSGADGKAHDFDNFRLIAQKSATDATAVNTFNNKAGDFIKSQSAQDQTTGNEVTFQIGANQGQVTNLGINDMSSSALQVDKVDVTTKAGAGSSVTIIDNALKSVSTERAKLGAMQNRLEHSISNLDTSSENLVAAESRIRDVDMAKEMMNYQKNNILQQAAQAMLAQANQSTQGVLQLLR